MLIRGIPTVTPWKIWKSDWIIIPTIGEVITAMFQSPPTRMNLSEKIWKPIALFSERDPMGFESIGIEATQNFLGNLLFCVGIIQYHLVIFLTVRHGKIHHAIQFGKPSISAIEKPWLALLVITRGYKKKSSDAASEIAQPGLSLAHLSKYCFHTSPERVSSACFVRCIDNVGSRWIKTKYETWV